MKILQSKKKKRGFSSKALLPKRNQKVNRRSVPAEADPRSSRRAFSLVLWGAFAATLVYTAFFSPFLAIQSVSVHGGSPETAREVEAFLYRQTDTPLWHVFPSRNLLLIPEGRLEREMLLAFPHLESAEVKTRFPHSAYIAVEERSALVLWCSAGPCYTVTKDGRLTEGAEAAERLSRDIPVYRVVDESALPVAMGEKAFDLPLAARIAEYAEVLPSRFGIPVLSEIKTPSRFSHEARFRTEDGFEFFADLESEPEETFQALELFFAQEVPKEELGSLRYIDFRTPNRIYYARKDAPQEQEAEESSEDGAEKEGDGTKPMEEKKD